jgi:hypothetical protein
VAVGVGVSVEVGSGVAARVGVAMARGVEAGSAVLPAGTTAAASGAELDAGGGVETRSVKGTLRQAVKNKKLNATNQLETEGQALRGIKLCITVFLQFIGVRITFESVEQLTLFFINIPVTDETPLNVSHHCAELVQVHKWRQNKSHSSG